VTTFEIILQRRRRIASRLPHQRSDGGCRGRHVHDPEGPGQCGPGRLLL